MVKRLGFLALFCVISGQLFAQSSPAAEGHKLGVWAGGEFSTFNPDYGCPGISPFTCFDHQLMGVAVYGDADHLMWNLGAEGEARWLRWHGPVSGEGMTDYLFGPRYEVGNYKRLSGYVKFLLGDASISLPTGSLGAGNYLAYAPGVTFRYAVARRVSARVDYEYQMWPSFKGDLSGSGGLTPNGFSFGVDYRILSRAR